MQVLFKKQAVAHNLCTAGVCAFLVALVLVACLMILSVFGGHIVDRL